MNAEEQQHDAGIQQELIAQALWEYKTKGVTVQLERPGFTPPLFGKIEIRDRQWVLVGTHNDAGVIHPFGAVHALQINLNGTPTVTIFTRNP